MLGIGLPAAVLIDATIVRGILLPAAMSLLGDRCWYLPRWLCLAARPSIAPGSLRNIQVSGRPSVRSGWSGVPPSQADRAAPTWRVIRGKRYGEPLAPPRFRPPYVRNQCYAGAHSGTHEIRRDKNNHARETGKTQLTGRFRRWWQVLGSNQRRLSRLSPARMTWMRFSAPTAGLATRIAAGQAAHHSTGQDNRPQVPLAEDQHPGGDPRPGRCARVFRADTATLRVW